MFSITTIINASSMDNIDPSTIGQKLTNGTAHVGRPILSQLRLRDEEHMENVGTRYQKTNAEIEIKKINRKEFWEQAKREEELRKEEERKKATEERQRFEKERIELERHEQKERDQRYRERERQIKEHRRKMQEEEEARERTRNQTLIMEPSCVDSAQDKKESEVEEAAAIIAQRANNPREFFRQCEQAMATEFNSTPTSTHKSDFADGTPEHAAEGLSPTPIPTIVTTPIQEEDNYQNVWDPEPEHHAPVQESALAKPVQSIAGLARETSDSSPSQKDHDLSDFGVQPTVPPQQEMDQLLDLWESLGPTPATAPSQASHLMDLMGDSEEAGLPDVSSGLPQLLLSFDDPSEVHTAEIHEPAPGERS